MSSPHEYIIIAGCGRLGSFLARLLSSDNKSVVVVDKNEEAFNNLTEEFSGFLIGEDITEIDTLIRAKIDKADVFVAATNDDNTNIMVAEIAKKIYQVPKVIARLYEPTKQELYQQLDIDTICPTILSAIAFKEIILAEEE